MNLFRSKDGLKTAFTEILAEIDVLLSEMEAQVASREFEERLDEMIRSQKMTAVFNRLEARHTARPCEGECASEDDPMVDQHSDLFKQDEPIIWGLDERKARIKRKVAFLYRLQGREILRVLRSSGNPLKGLFKPF